MRSQQGVKDNQLDVIEYMTLTFDAIVCDIMVLY